MTYEEALSILRSFLHFLVPSARANGKTMIAYKRFEAFCKAIEALEKQIPKKPRETRCALMCANCGHKITEKGCKKLYRNYCKKCGQAIDWEVDE